MVGNSIKFDPAWVVNKTLKRSIEEVTEDEAKKSISSAMSYDSINKMK